MENRSELEPGSNGKNTSPEAFIPPRHWIGPEELEESYWKDAKTQEKRGQEFFEKPVEWLDRIEKSGQGGIARRDFLTLMGASMAMAGAACARRPVHKIIPYVVKPEDITPGVPTWYASTCHECSASCGVLVKDREGRPIKLEGNPDHPVNQGTLCSRGQASVLGLYDPDRLKEPLARSRREGGAVREISWADVDTAITGQLKALAAGAGRVRLLTGDIQSPTTRRLISEFLAPFKNASHVEFEPLNNDQLAQSQGLSYGTDLFPNYRFAKANLVVSFGADFMNDWNSSLGYSREWSKGRKLTGPANQAKMSKLICFEPNFSLTGSNADERFPIQPGDELKLTLAVAYELIIHQKKSKFSADPQVIAALAGYTPQQVANEMGLEGGSGLLQRIASELWENRGKSLVLAGSTASRNRDALALQIAVNLLNSALENEGSTVDGTLNFSASHASFASFAKLVADLKSGQVDALIIWGTNPAYSAPAAALGLEDGLKKVPLVISISDRDDETAQWADYVLPDHHYLEAWGDASPRPGLYSLRQPVIAPLHSSRGFEENLLIWAKAIPGISATSGVGRVKDWHEYLMSQWKETLYQGAALAGTFDQFWTTALRLGVYDAKPQNRTAQPTARSFNLASLSYLPKYAPGDRSGILLALYPKVSLYDGRNANNPWLQELPDPLSSVTWDNYLNVGTELAKKLGLKENDVVEVTSGNVVAQLPVHVQPGLDPHVVTAALGYGRRRVGKVGNLTGVDVYPWVQVNGSQLVFAGQDVRVKKTGKIYQLASTQWHTATEDRPIINDITLKEFRQNPGTSNPTDPELRLEKVPTIWPTHEYKGYRWGMGIDLTSCIGCSACMIACQAENNVPVVGRDNVRVSRQMHWIRIDRYFSQSPSSPDVVFQPMLCQHCENASCETVCPVLATVHDDEGLNVQVYNRCVGTRYCQNNCPYKVRRFNFFDHWKSYAGTMNLAWNPDVTVRSRGIMEKCTFCTQRIQAAKDHAKDLGVKVGDGDVKTACQQTCPTDAIVFGDLNDPESRVSKMKESPQAFRVLEVLNNKPSVSYMTKVRNKAKG